MTNKKIRVKDFPEGLLVLRQVKGPHKVPKEGKLIVNQEGFFKVKQNLKNGAYELEIIKGKPIT